MPKQGNRSHSKYPEHVEQVRQKNETKGNLVMASGSEWAGDDARDQVYMAAEADSWWDTVLMR